MKKYSFFSFILLAVLTLLCCGRKGPLLPPMRKAPLEVEILEVFQRGGKIILRWKNPISYLDGTPLTDISEVDIWIYKKKDEGESPPSVDLKTFSKESSLLISIKRSEFSKFEDMIHEDSQVYMYSTEIKPSDYKGILFFFGIKALDKRGRESDFKEPISVKPRIVSRPPFGLKAEAALDKVVLDWEPPKGNIDGSTPAYVKGYNIYRSLREGEFGRLNDGLVNENRYEDGQIGFGVEYKYFVRSSDSEEPPFLESENSEIVKILVEDTVPPEKPEGLVLIAFKDRITLTWDLIKAEDFHGYNVWRRIKGEGEFTLLTPDSVQENIFHDFSAEKETEYEYCVSSCDKAGNESQRSDVITGTLKGCVS